MKNAARVLVAAMLAPLLIVAGPVGRAAADGSSYEIYGDHFTKDIKRKDTGGLFGWDCRITAYFHVNYSNDTGESRTQFADIAGDVSCSNGRLSGDVYVTKLEFMPVLSPPLTQCVYVHEGASGGHNIDTANGRSFPFQAMTPGGFGPGCSESIPASSSWARRIVAVCITTSEQGEEMRDCEPMNIEPPPPATPDAAGGQCARGSLVAPYVTGAFTEGSAGSWRWLRKITFRIPGITAYGSMKVSGLDAQMFGYIRTNGGTRFSVAGAFAPGRAPDQRWNQNGVAHSVSFDKNAVNTVSLASTIVVTLESTSALSGAVGSSPAFEVLSAGYWTSPSSDTSASTSFGTDSGGEVPLTDSTWAAGGPGVTGWVGHTQLKYCFAGWGIDAFTNAPLADGVSPTVPTGPAGSEPPPYVPPRTTPPVYDPPTAPDDDSPNPLPDPEGDECSFSLTDPTSWGGQLICVMVKLIKGLVSAIGDVVSAILGLVQALLDGLLDLFKTLFVPDADVFTDAIDEVKEAWSNNTLGNWLGAFTANVPTAPAGGCAGPHVSPDFSFGAADGMVMEAEPLNACSGTAATIAGYCRAALTVWIVWYGALAGMRILGGGFGWSPSVGRGES